MLQKIRPHLFLALSFTLLTLLQQYSFYALKGLPIILLPAGKYIGIFIFLFLFTFAKGLRTRFLLLSFVLILCFFQLCHLSYFGTQVLPAEIYLLFSQFHEITGTLKEETHHVLLPLLFTLLPMLLGFMATKKFSSRYELRVVVYLFVIYFAYNPIRTYVTGNTWGRQPSTRELAGMNVYLSTSYFLGKILPNKMSHKNTLEENSSLKLQITASQKSPWDKIIVVLGESLSPHHMSVFQYDRETTPFLSSLKKSPKFFHTIGLSSGVSTDISVAFFLNLGFGPAAAFKAAKGNHCLFKLAKTNGLKTHFLSIQSAQQLRYIAPYICNSALDDYRNLEDLSPTTEDHQAANDRDLLPHLEKILSEDGQHLVFLHQRGSHSPWNLRYSSEAQRFKDERDPKINDYDNSVFEFDLFWRDLNKLASNSSQKILLVYISDHGEAVGEQGLWGHGFLHPLAFEVPVLIQSFNQDLPVETRELPVNLPQYNLSLYLLKQIGLETNQKATSTLDDYVIFGNDIDGFAGKATIKFGPYHQYQFKVLP